MTHQILKDICNRFCDGVLPKPHGNPPSWPHTNVPYLNRYSMMFNCNDTHESQVFPSMTNICWCFKRTWVKFHMISIMKLQQQTIPVDNHISKMRKNKNKKEPENVSKEFFHGIGWVCLPFKLRKKYNRKKNTHFPSFTQLFTRWSNVSATFSHHFLSYSAYYIH